MSSLIYNDAKKISGLDRSRRKSVNLQRLLKIIIIVLAIILTLELLYHFVLSERLVLNSIFITADPDLDLNQEQVISAAALKGDENFFTFNPADTRNRLLALPAVKTAVVTKKFPDKIYIDLKARKALAASLVQSDRGIVPLIFDSDGIVFQSGRDKIDEDMPIISGLNFPSPEIGIRLPEEAVGYLSQMEEVKKNFPELLKLFSEFKIIKKGNFFTEVLLYPEHIRIRVRTGAEIDEKLLKHILLVLDVIDKQGIADKVEELDFRTDEPVFRIREG